MGVQFSNKGSASEDVVGCNQRQEINMYLSYVHGGFILTIFVLI